MDNQEVIDKKKLLKNVKIKNQPEVIHLLRDELYKEEPSFKKLTDLIGKDVATTAEVINVSNSPLFSLRKQKITTIKKALFVLGLNNFVNCILTFILNNSVKNKNVPPKKYNAFNKHSMLVENIAQSIAHFLRFNRKSS